MESQIDNERGASSPWRSPNNLIPSSADGIYFIQTVHEREFAMSDTSEILLNKYYGFGADPNNKKFLSSHDAMYDSSKFDRISKSIESTEKEAIEETAGLRPSLEVH